MANPPYDAQYLIPSANTAGYGMGRSLVNHDGRSRNFRAVELIPTGEREVRRKTWPRSRAYDQGGFPHCVAFTGKGIYNSRPLSVRSWWGRRSRYNTTEWYYGAQRNDEWEGEAYEGTSALGLCRYLKLIGLLSEYRWCFGLTDVLLTVSKVGPVALGIWWYGGMFTPSTNGFIYPTGSRAGGHEVEIVGVTPSTRLQEGYVTICNSWGYSWSLKGRCKLAFGDLDRLLREDGDAVVLLT